jgi:hydrogenase-4 membrane subunit HyfE
MLHDELGKDADLQAKYFTAAISSILIGLFIAINNRDLVTHLISYLIIENGIFLLSLALGAAMPMFANAAIPAGHIYKRPHHGNFLQQDERLF